MQRRQYAATLAQAYGYGGSTYELAEKVSDEDFELIKLLRLNVGTIV
jgi:hypothetical protein